MDSYRYLVFKTSIFNENSCRYPAMAELDTDDIDHVRECILELCYQGIDFLVISDDRILTGTEIWT